MAAPEDAAAAPFFFELLAPEARRDPYPLYHRFRETEPVNGSPVGLWTLSRHADILSVLRDPRFSADPRNATAVEDLLPADHPRPIREGAGKVLLFTDPPDHTRLRGLVNKAFTARVVAGLRPHIAELVDGLLDGVEEAGEMDVIADLAYPLPVLVICELMGVPSADRDRFREWSRDVAPVLDPFTPADKMDRVLTALESFFGYFAELVEERRSRPREDLLSALIAAEDREDRLNHEELMAICLLVFIAGHETTQNLIGNGLWALLCHPGELERLKTDPPLVRNAIEEMLRYDSPVQLTARAATEDVEVGGERIRKGEEAILLLGAGNRDPDVFPEPDRLDVGREGVQHLSFGAGIHFCLGAPLARVEGEIVFRKLLERMPDLEPSGDPEWRETLTLRGLRTLPVKL